MRIVDRQAFLAMPRGTLFSKLDTSGALELRIKLDTVGENDFVYRDMLEIDASGSAELFEWLWQACEEKTRTELPLDWYPDMSRDGLFDDEQLFAVLEQSEVTALIALLETAKTEAFPETASRDSSETQEREKPKTLGYTPPPEVFLGESRFGHFDPVDFRIPPSAICSTPLSDLALQRANIARESLEKQLREAMEAAFRDGQDFLVGPIYTKEPNVHDIMMADPFRPPMMTTEIKAGPVPFGVWDSYVPHGWKLFKCPPESRLTGSIMNEFGDIRGSMVTLGGAVLDIIQWGRVRLNRLQADMAEKYGWRRVGVENLRDQPLIIMERSEEERRERK